MNERVHNQKIEFTKASYYGFIGIIKTNPSVSMINSGMHVTDYHAGFGNHNFGCTVKISPDDNISITLKTIMEG